MRITFNLDAANEGWEYKKSATGFIQQNAHMMTYWKGMVHILPRLSKIMLFVLQAPCSSSSLERYFSTISLNTSAHASNRDTEYIEQINQNHPQNDEFFAELNRLYLLSI